MGMLELLTGTGLAAAAGLNAYIPLLLVGLSSRFLDWIQLPPAWAWLENEWVLVVLGVLFVIEIIADKIPVVDTVNDWIQTVVRPAAGGILFGSGTSSETVAVTDPAEFFASNQWVPIVIGIVLSLVVHAGKTFSRPAANAVTAGVAAPVLSTLEDITSVVLSLLAILFPILVIVGVVGLAVGLVALFRRMRRKRRTDDAIDISIPEPPDADRVVDGA
ncbi:membrane protein [Pseudolysinimonas yzui]|uniref:Membrane protein n=2 Tax=Pseudolysinimonas yzui TaxID=2708254 RepID=A0A8J3LZ80_9MICO|nr:membrane protein [Pseudolysinimonas yzui]